MWFDWAFQAHCWALSFECHCRMTYCLLWTHKRRGFHLLWTISEEEDASQRSMLWQGSSCCELIAFWHDSFTAVWVFAGLHQLPKCLTEGKKWQTPAAVVMHTALFYYNIKWGCVFFLFRHRNPKAGWSLEQMERKSAGPLLLTSWSKVKVCWNSLFADKTYFFP